MFWQTALRLRFWAFKRRSWPLFVTHCSNTKATQARLLADILMKNRDTGYGKRYDFESIESIDQYRHTLPISKYADLEADLIALRDSGARSLIAEAPVYYALTSGTSSNPKYIPITLHMQRDHQHAQSLALLRQIELVPKLYAGKILAFMSPHEESKTKLGVPCGSLSGLLFEKSSRLVASRFAVPSEIFNLADFNLRQTLIALFAMLSAPVTTISAVNPSTLIRFEQFLVESRLELAALLELGSLTRLEAAAAKFEDRFLSVIARANNRVELIRILRSSSSPLIGQLFPDVLGITTWLGGNCGYYAKKLPDLFLSKPALLEAGYIASEFRGSVPIEPLTAAGIPTISENFFEFISIDEWEQGNRETKLLHELKLGQQYYIIVTTKGGLYRYFINDIVHAEDSSFGLPAIKFVQKGSGVSSITGEKLYEEQAIKAVERSSQQEGIKIEDFILVAEIESSRYRLYYEGTQPTQSFSETLDCALAEQNLEYASKRSSQRLQRVEIAALKPGTLELRKQALIQARGREGQYKAPKLLARPEQLFNLNAYAI